MTGKGAFHDGEGMRLSMIRNVFSYDELGFVPAYAYLERWVNKLIISMEELDLLGAVGIAVPVDREKDEGYLIEFVEWERSGKLKSDRKAKEYRRQCRKGELYFQPAETALGTLIQYLVEPESADGSFRELQECARSWLEKPKDVSIKCFTDPGKAFDGRYESSFDKEARYMLVYPIISDDGRSLLGMFGFDLLEGPGCKEMNDRDEAVNIRLNQELLSLKHILEQFLWSYYTYLDTNPTERGWEKWTHEGRVFSPTYFFKLVGALRTWKRSHSTPREVEKEANSREHRLDWLCSDRVAVFYADADGIKGLNDTFGHDVGNLVIRGIGASMWRALPWRRIDSNGESAASPSQATRGALARKQGVVVRWGGDEFIVVLPLDCGTSARGDAVAALTFMKNLEIELLVLFGDIPKHAIARASNVTAVHEKVGLSIGWGVVECPGDIQDGDRWLRRIENAMYVCKAAGKLAREANKKDRQRDLETPASSELGGPLLPPPKEVVPKVAALCVRDAERLRRRMDLCLWRHSESSRREAWKV